MYFALRKGPIPQHHASIGGEYFSNMDKEYRLTIVYSSSQYTGRPCVIFLQWLYPACERFTCMPWMWRWYSFWVRIPSINGYDMKLRGAMRTLLKSEHGLVISLIAKCGMELFIHSQTSTVQRDRYITSSDAISGKPLLINTVLSQVPYLYI